MKQLPGAFMPAVKVLGIAGRGGFSKDRAESLKKTVPIIVSRILYKIIYGQFLKEWQIVTYLSYRVCRQ